MDIEKTRDALIRETAEKLNIVGTGQPLEPEYGARIDSNIDPLLLQLASDGVCQVVDTDHIPSEWFDALAGLLANVCASIGGKTYDPTAKDVYEAQLRRLVASSPSYAVLESEYY